MENIYVLNNGIWYNIYNRTKRLIQLRPNDWAKVLLPEYEEILVTEMKPDKTPDEIIEETVKIIDTIENEALKSDILVAMSIFAMERYSGGLVRKYVRREMLMDSPLFEEWIKEERDEAAIKATMETTRNKIIEVLIEKFDFVSEDIIEDLNNIKSLSMLNQLFTKSIKVISLDEFTRLLNIIKK